MPHVRCVEVYEREDCEFLCPGCQELHCFCEGANDELPELCDDCWYELTTTSKELP